MKMQFNFHVVFIAFFMFASKVFTTQAMGETNQAVIDFSSLTQIPNKKQGLIRLIVRAADGTEFRQASRFDVGKSTGRLTVAVFSVMMRDLGWENTWNPEDVTLTILCHID